MIDPGRSQDTFEQASLWSPCYDDDAQAARLTFWSDLGSSVQTLNALTRSDYTVPLDDVWTQFEISLSREFFFDPMSTSTSKLARIHRGRTAECVGQRFGDMRFLGITPSAVVIGPEIACQLSGGAKYGAVAEGTAVSLDPDAHAGHWIRITTHYDIDGNAVNFWAYDVTADNMITSGQITQYKGNPMDFAPHSGTVGSFSFVQHSSSHEPVPGHTSPHYWVRHAIMSSEPISP